MIPFQKVRSRCNGNEDKEEWLLTLKLTGARQHERTKMTKCSTGNHFNGALALGQNEGLTL